MILPVQTGQKGWQPLTPRGAAAFAKAPWARLLLVQFVVAALIAASVVWFLSTNWFPSIRAAIQQLPTQGEIRSGRLAWAGDSPRVLSKGNFIAFVVDLNHSGQVRLPVHLQVEFGRDNIRVFSLFGYAEYGYPKETIIAFNRPELEPWWGAWAPPILWIGVAITIVGLMAAWTLLAAVYCLPVWLIGFFANRDLNLRASWKLAGAALMPGALLAAGAIVFYGLGMLDLMKFMATLSAHLVTGWIYSLVSPFFAPKLRSVTAVEGNPFVVPTSGRTEQGESRPGSSPPLPGA
jgi:hypothetical protein